MKSFLKIRWKTKITFLLSETLLFFLEQKYILFLQTYFFKISKNLIASISFSEADTKKHSYALAKASNAALVKFNGWIIKNDHVINCCFSVSHKHDRTSKVIWLSTTWLSIFQLEVADKKPLFTKLASTWIEISWLKDIIFHGYKILYATPGWYARKMLFANLPKNIINWFLTLQPDIFYIIANLSKRAQER